MPAGLRRAALGAVAALALGVLATAPLAAQRVIVRERTAAPTRMPMNEVEAADWLRELQRQQAREAALVATLRALAQNDGSPEQRRVVERDLREVVRNVVRLRSGLDAMCERSGDEVAGWMGLTFTGSLRVIKRDSEAPVYTFLDYPVVQTIEPGSPAAKAGVAAGDVLVALNRRDLREGDVVFAHLLKPGTKLPLRYRREGREKEVTLRIVKRPEGFAASCRTFAATAQVPGAVVFRTDGRPLFTGTPRAPRAPQSPRGASAAASAAASRAASAGAGEAPLPPAPPGAPLVTVFGGTGSAVLFGAEVTRVAGDLGEVLGVKDGVLVTNVLPGGPAEAAGLRGGDVIVKAGAIDVTSPRDLQRARWDAEGREIPLEIVRRKKRETAVLRW